MGKTAKRELMSCLHVLLLQLLKWQFQPDRRGAAWQATIRVQRRAQVRHLADDPSLRAGLSGFIAEAYGDAVIEAAGETGLLEAAFPAICAWSFEEFMVADFWPDGAG